ncbi:MAG: glycoside hydrolase, partial [Deinococcota bacterium]|nr:glycoside hydrolase [Deinococcota bacterium]
MRVSLSGQWQFRLDHETTWRPIHVPGCWEDLGVAKNHPGPGWYRTKLNVPERAHGKRLWMHFESVSYHAVILINDRVVGEHLGLWDAFRLEVTGALTPGETAELLVRVEKPASLVRGPASDAVPGRYPLKETLAGFLPYVWGHIFGGIWQAVYLEATDGAVFDAVSVRGDALGTVRAEANLSDAAELQLTIRDAAGAITHSETARGKDLVLMGALAKPALWSPANPTLYHATLAITGGETRTLSFGFRTLAVDSTDVLLNGKAIYPRFALSWGWYPESLYSNPGRERVREDLLKLKALGYNGVKLCLWVPPHYYFELADELGMLLWLELPMWLPKPTPFWHQQTPLEYRRVVQQVRYHPAIIMYSLGCELNREVSADILEALYEDVKGLVGDALLRDNSGSGEAYGGLLNEYADYYDYHFYSDIQFFRPLIDYFTPRWRPEQPWVFGEFCDLDTFRNLQKVIDANEGEKPWWLQTDDNLNPQGARWQFDIVEQEERLKANGFWARGDELELISHKQALLHRKFTLELVRTYREISGYVITGERDTPISTAGMWDDLGAFKFPPDAFKAFNQDLVLALGWGKRRAWVAGGDRAAHWDTFSYPAGATVRAHLILSHYGQARGKAKVGWRVTRADGSLVADGVVVSQEDFKPG